MKVVLTADVKNVGKSGQVVEVAAGYGRNYLIARGLAVAATSENVHQSENIMKARQDRTVREEREAREAAASLNGKTVQCRVKAGEKGKLYGSVSTKDVADAVARETGMTVDRHKFEIKEQIKAVGSYPVTVRLYAGVTAEITVEVRAAE